MTTIIEGIYKKGVIKPLEDIRLKDNTRVVITIGSASSEKEAEKGGIMRYAGAWKNYKTFDGKALNELKDEIYRDREFSTRKDANL